MKSIGAIKELDVKTQLIYALDDKEKMRVRVLRRLVADLILLEDALAANSRNPPKAHVVADHVDRVISSLKQEVKKLKAEK